MLVKTSNPSSGEFQDRLVDGRPLYELVGEKVAQWGEEHMGDSYSYVEPWWELRTQRWARCCAS